MSDTCPTIKILRDGVEVVINLSDYDPKVHKVAGEETVATTKTVDDMSATELREYAKENNIDIKGLKSKDDLLAAVKGEAFADTLMVIPTAEGKFQIVDEQGQSVDGEVYESLEDAEKALNGE